MELTKKLENLNEFNKSLWKLHKFDQIIIKSYKIVIRCSNICKNEIKLTKTQHPAKLIKIYQIYQQIYQISVYFIKRVQDFHKINQSCQSNLQKLCKSKNQSFCQKDQILKMTQKSISAYPKIPKSDFSKFIEFLYKIPHFSLQGVIAIGRHSFSIQLVATVRRLLQASVWASWLAQGRHRFQAMRTRLAPEFSVSPRFLLHARAQNKTI